ncbi:nucleic acid/nucleotide deaminase domain-containing protein [Streptomyces sp. NPDC056149]|uniref:nucleic acid/nucleotide deaminase domain-containing protein n=1 Tax=unclassified Streptomyces TaxID=2593676 RepID=UPI002380CBF8|nr:nucleic acid/nucleotide deaminase domain-containing protein [Streptomyces sp. WZ-12]
MTNRIVKALEDGAGKLAKTLGKDAGKAVQDLYHDTGKRLKRVADNHLETDAKHAAEMERIAKRPRTETPVYHLDDRGNISRLRHNPGAKTPEERYKKEKLTSEDKERLGLQSSSIGGPRKGEQAARLKNKQEGRTDPRPTSSSTPVAQGSSDLAQATQLARHADNSYGTHRGGEFSSNNYAAARITGANDKGDFILVGRSHRGTSEYPGAHSERMIGTPFLRQGEGNRIRDLYTERAPCGPAANCSAWMAERLSHVNVSHTFEYGNTTASRAAGNAAMQQYLDGLKASR